ncbi:MAG: hypothetical protein N4A44_03220 [Alphaproteobacteria bacterium]|jgi:hypothetical protein|nr:hypothetical protein [Alphaproteobacteria bacterium]
MKEKEDILLRKLDAISGPIDLISFLNDGINGKLDEYGSHMKDLCFNIRESAMRTADWEGIVEKSKFLFGLEENNFKFIEPPIDLLLSINTSLN